MQADFQMRLVFAVVVLVYMWGSYCGASAVAVLVFIYKIE